ncbi:hypothetical protein [Streptomyces sp. NPDC051098]|uniref:hypothetical protein n=1 Tax=Streptomyces sp. NPDC051098 TaxID=3155411 RepID=UPI0034466428
MMASVAAVTPAGRSTVRRNHRVAAGALLAGSPSGNQTHELPSREGASVSAEGAAIHFAVHWDAPISPVSHHEGALHSEAPPSASHARTDQK